MKTLAGAVLLGAGPVLAATTVAGFAQNATVPGAFRSYSTMHSIGIEWDLAGDANHNATCRVLYRKTGETAWKEAMPLFRVDMPRGWYVAPDVCMAEKPSNMFAGSILFLSPGPSYEVKLDLQDPDGGNQAKSLTIQTRVVPVLPRGGATYHAVPGNGGGDGSSGNPFKGLSEAQTKAGPGDVVLIHRGEYGSFEFTKPGAASGNYLAWKAAGDGDVIFTGIVVSGSDLWFEGLTVKATSGAHHGIRTSRPMDNVVLLRNTILGFDSAVELSDYSAQLADGCDNWYIADNVIVGNHDDPNVSKISGEGIEMNKGSGHTLAHNRISHVADGISSGHSNIDIFGNDIFDVTDDGVEPDGCYSNIRVWENRINNAFNAGFSFQPQFGAPWYFIRNQVVTKDIIKPCLVDRFVLANNTFVSWVWVQSSAEMLFAATVKNNLWIWAGGGWGAIWHAERHERFPGQSPPTVGYAPDWRTDIDYNGFDWGTDGGERLNNPFVWDTGKDGARTAYPDIPSFSKAIGVEQHGTRVERAKIFESFAGVSFNKDIGHGRLGLQYLTLKPRCNAIDAGVAMPNLNDGYTGKAPDLGAYEFGKPVPHYGPRHLPVQGGEPLPQSM